MMTRIKTFILLAAAIIGLEAHAQELPQFSSSSFDGWSYNGGTLDETEIAIGHITLYVTRQGLVLTLTSPEFQCTGIDSIAAEVRWYTQSFFDDNFVLSQTALTMTIDDSEGNPMDSVTCVPTITGVSNQDLKFSLPMPQGLTRGRLRFVSWQADVTSCGAIKWIILSPIGASPQPGVLVGDVDNNGSINIADVTALVDYLLSGNSVSFNPLNADLDNDGNINIADVTALIDKLLSGR